MFSLLPYLLRSLPDCWMVPAVLTSSMLVPSTTQRSAATLDTLVQSSSCCTSLCSFREMSRNGEHSLGYTFLEIKINMLNTTSKCQLNYIIHLLWYQACIASLPELGIGCHCVEFSLVRLLNFNHCGYVGFSKCLQYLRKLLAMRINISRHLWIILISSPVIQLFNTFSQLW